MKTVHDFQKQQDYLVCVDSDGCVMDTMDIKHSLCFGPCLIDEWELYSWREEILVLWNKINLYSLSRGINRFKGLAMTLSIINEKYTTINGIDTFISWTENTKELSNKALEAQITKENSPIFSKALSWSLKVNKAIDDLPKKAKLPFPYAKEALKVAHRQADVAIISSANLDAIIKEWNHHDLLSQVDIVTSQNDGSKSYCIAELLKKGYDKNKVIMCGDAVGDVDAAQANGVFFYPISAKREEECWKEFISLGFCKFLDGKYKEYEKEKIHEFYNNLNK